MTEEKKSSSFYDKWVKPVLMCWTPRQYRRLIEEPLLPALVAVLLIGALQGAVVVSRVLLQYPKMIDETAVQWDKSLPKVSVKNGIASTAESKTATAEIVIGPDAFKIIVATSGEKPALDPAWQNAMLIASREITIRQTPPEMKSSEQRYSWSDLNNRLGDLTLDGAGIRSLSKKAAPYWAGTIFFQGMLNFVMIKAAHIFLGFIAALAVSFASRRKIAYMKILILGCYAVIPALIFELFGGIFASSAPRAIGYFFFYLYMAVYLSYVTLAVLNLDKATIEEKKK